MPQARTPHVLTDLNPVKAGILSEVLQAAIAVVVVDMQRDFCAPDGALALAGVDVAKNTAIVQPIARFVGQLRAAGALIIWVHQQHNALLTSGAVVRRVRRATQHLNLCVDGTPGAELTAGIGAENGDVHIHKYRYSAFMGSNLDMLLRSQRIETVVVCGTAANACVGSTVRDAAQLDYNVVVCADLTGYSDARLGVVALENLDRHFAIVCNAADVQTRVVHHERQRRPGH